MNKKLKKVSSKHRKKTKIAKLKVKLQKEKGKEEKGKEVKQ
jgi:hypothetical protein